MGDFSMAPSSLPSTTQFNSETRYVQQPRDRSDVIEAFQKIQKLERQKKGLPMGDFGSVDQFKEVFIQAGTTQFGSGWAWLAIDNGKLVVTKSANASNPLVDGMKPILGCDVWEHSYYIDYRNKRPDYLKAFLDSLVNWEFVASQLD